VRCFPTAASADRLVSIPHTTDQLDDYILGPEGEAGGAAGLEPGVCSSRLVG
jgi:hypothetical protein